MAFNAAAQINGQPKVDRSSIRPDGMGPKAAARLLGTLVTLAAVTRSSGGTIAITYDCRAGTSICDNDDLSSRKTMVSAAFGISAASSSKPFDGRCV